MMIKFNRRAASLRGFQDDKGFAAVEFALILPAMIALYFGVVELTLGFSANSRVTHIASITADLVAQADVVDDNDLNNIMDAAAVLVEPFDKKDLALILTSVRIDSNKKVEVDWSVARGASAHGTGGGFSLPVNLIEADTSVIVAEVTYQYKTPGGMFLPKSIGLDDIFYLRPRKSDYVQKN